LSFSFRLVGGHGFLSGSVSVSGSISSVLYSPGSSQTAYPAGRFQFLVAKRHPDLLFDPDSDTDPDPDVSRFPLSFSFRQRLNEHFSRLRENMLNFLVVQFLCFLQSVL